MKKRGGLLALAVALLCAVPCLGAAPALASNFAFESSPTWLLGQQESTFAFGFSSGKVKATTATFKSSEIVGTSASSVALRPEYGGLTAFGLQANLSTNGCTYVLKPSTTTEGVFSIACEPGQEITISVPKASCTLKIPAQTPATPTVKFANLGSGATRDVRADLEVAGVTYTTSGGGVCGESGTNGTITVTETLKGFGTASFTSQHGIWVE
jgi:hypothetical protein